MLALIAAYHHRECAHSLRLSKQIFGQARLPDSGLPTDHRKRPLLGLLVKHTKALLFSVTTNQSRHRCRISVRY